LVVLTTPRTRLAPTADTIDARRAK